MLVGLRIENFALIDSLDLQFGAGMTVLTGETGAGKSIILEAIDAALGGKVSSRSIRAGADRSVVEATFELDANGIQWLKEQEIEPLDGLFLVCSRELANPQENRRWRWRSRLNGIVVNRQQMEQLRLRIVEITAQGQTVQLGRPALQREWLDVYGGEVVLSMRDAVAAAFDACEKAREALDRRRTTDQVRLQRIDQLEYQLQELTAANLDSPDELEVLEKESQRLAHCVELQQQCYQVYQAIYQCDRDSDFSGTVAAADLLGKAERIMSEMIGYDRSLQGILEMVSQAHIQVTEAGRQLFSYSTALESDPQRLEEIQARIRQLKLIARKYGPTLAEAIAHYQCISSELEELTSNSQTLDLLEKSYEEAKHYLYDACSKLHIERRVAADKLETHLVEQLKPLAMENVRFKVTLTPNTPCSNGSDRVVFELSANPGEPLQPLVATASGGEMSRFLLALKACFSQVDGAGTLLFDEIDTGVSGRVAGAIASKLYQLSGQHQILCVTHQPIVAAMADHHFHVNKQVIPQPMSEAERTVVQVKELDNQQRHAELAQMTGGQSATQAYAFAESLLAEAAKLRQSLAIYREC
ncbi:MAG: DNA repair protein RecN [Hormoscilla sp. GUM202]|nr:DNA repair protein RecN [Hormoscilla sp. GUM202]